MVGPPPVKPLQPAKKVQILEENKPAHGLDHQKGKLVIGGDKAQASGGQGVAAAAAALEKSDKPKEKRISTMTEVQIMEKLRSVVDDSDPKLIYSKIKKIGQG